MRIVVDDLTGPDIAEFLDAHLQQMRSLTPLESKHALDLDALRRPEITFWSVLHDDEAEADGEGEDGSGGRARVVGCGALKQLDATHAELKSMRTQPARKRSGIASMLLQHILHEARSRGYSRLSLETGSAEFFLPARKLYEKFGFTECEPFADYRPDPNSTFMTRAL